MLIVSCHAGVLSFSPARLSFALLAVGRRLPALVRALGRGRRLAPSLHASAALTSSCLWQSPVAPCPRGARPGPLTIVLLTGLAPPVPHQSWGLGRPWSCPSLGRYSAPIWVPPGIGLSRFLPASGSPRPAPENPLFCILCVLPALPLALAPTPTCPGCFGAQPSLPIQRSSRPEATWIQIRAWVPVFGPSAWTWPVHTRLLGRCPGS